MPGANGEQILAVIPNVTLNAGFMGVKSRQHTLVLTDRRILFARFTTTMAKDLGQQPAPDPQLLSELAAVNDAFAALVARYATMTGDQILAEHSDNFAVDRSSVRKVSIKQSSAGADVTTDVLTIKTDGKKYKLTLTSPKQARNALTRAGLLT